MKKLFLIFAINSLVVSFAFAESKKVTVFNFVRAETDMTLDRYFKLGAFCNFYHLRNLVPIDQQNVIRMNRDTLYSAGIFDLTKPVIIKKPDPGDRFQSMLIINQDHSIFPAEHGPGDFIITEEKIGTRYVIIVFRTLAIPNDPKDIAQANALQDQITFEQADCGSFEIPNWDEKKLGKIRDAINVLAADVTDSADFFGQRDKLDPIKHLLGTAYGWGGNPKEAAMYDNFVPKQNDGLVAHTVTVKDVPVDAFWSITVYNAKGFMVKNDLNIYSYNNLTAIPNNDGSFTINFGGNLKQLNYMPIMKGWSIIIRMYRPRPEIINRTWIFPKPVPVN